MKQAEVYYRKSDHLTRIMTGLHLLEEQKILSCRYIEDRECKVVPATAWIVEVRIDGKRIAFDMSDAPGLYQQIIWEYLAGIDMMFVRSHLDWSAKTEHQEQLHKIHPYGFNYFTTYPGNPAYESNDSDHAVKKIMRNLINHSRWTRVEAFEGKAKRVTGKPRIIFMTRLWDPAGVKIRPDTPAADRAHREMRIMERQRINAERIEICRKLKETYGDSFFGGIQRSEFSLSVCPELVLPAHTTLKMNYLKRMKKADICVGSSGLEKSIGWKTGEYVAAARAIVCEKPVYILPGGFEEGKNYLSYSDVDSCLAAVDKLYHDHELLYQMQLANEQYYQKYLRPEMQIINALKISGISI